MPPKGNHRASRAAPKPSAPAQGQQKPVIIEISSGSEDSSDENAPESSKSSVRQRSTTQQNARTSSLSNRNLGRQKVSEKGQQGNTRRRSQRPIVGDIDDEEDGLVPEPRLSKRRKSKRIGNIYTPPGALAPQDNLMAESSNGYEFDITSQREIDTDDENQEDLKINMEGRSTKSTTRTLNKGKGIALEGMNSRPSGRSLHPIIKPLPPSTANHSHQQSNPIAPDVSDSARLSEDRPNYHELQTRRGRQVKVPMPPCTYRLREHPQLSTFEDEANDPGYNNKNSKYIDFTYTSNSTYVDDSTSTPMSDAEPTAHLSSDIPLPSVEQAYAREQRAKLRASRRLQ